MARALTKLTKLAQIANVSAPPIRRTRIILYARPETYFKFGGPARIVKVDLMGSTKKGGLLIYTGKMIGSGPGAQPEHIQDGPFDVIPGRTEAMNGWVKSSSSPDGQFIVEGDPSTITISHDGRTYRQVRQVSTYRGTGIYE